MLGIYDTLKTYFLWKEEFETPEWQVFDEMQRNICRENLQVIKLLIKELRNVQKRCTVFSSNEHHWILTE